MTKKVAIAIIMLCVCLESCTTTSVPQYVGVYHVDLNASKLGNYATIDSIQDLTLTIRDDSTFHFSKDVPFILQQNGKWNLQYLEPLDLPPFYKCSFDYDGNHREDVLVPMDDDIKGCYFNSPVSKGDYVQVELLCFKRIGSE